MEKKKAARAASGVAERTCGKTEKINKKAAEGCRFAKGAFCAENFPFEKVTQPLVEWFNYNKRDLPWRHNPTPYRVWVSEIMLQQTRVEAARDYYLRFLSALPSVADLAACDEEKLMKLWEGLGYYSRVRNMQKTAKIICGTYGGEFPSDEKQLRALPGIGDYTAGAIRSIAFGLPSPAVDGNVLRVCSRLAADGTDISDENYKALLKALLQNAYPPTPQGCSDFTQALMELGALICTPRVVACEKCPLRALCRAAETG
ncbi:MAG: A/G-specific adenine glycosylase, partial [Candidatus Scatosoma sp.]